MKIAKNSILVAAYVLLSGCVQHSQEVRYTYCPEPVPIPDCVKFGDIESVCFQKWMEKQNEVNKKLTEGQKWRWKDIQR